MRSCPRCKGLQIADHEETRCFSCGYRPTHNTASNSPPKKKPASLFPISWLGQKGKSLGPSCIVTVRRILYQLPRPFMHRFKNRKAYARRKLPCFFFDPEYRRETGKIIAYRNRVEWKRLEGKGKEIKGLIAGLPKQNRKVVRAIAWLCDERMKEKVKLEDCLIQWFLKTIEREQKWLDALRPLGSLLEARTQPGLFPFAPADSLIKSCGPLSILSFCGNIQKRLDRAHTIVHEARTKLEPAKEFYLKPHFSREAKKALLDSVLLLPSSNKKEAAALVTSLLHLVDPKRPVKLEDIRQMYYGR